MAHEDLSLGSICRLTADALAELMESYQPEVVEVGSASFCLLTNCSWVWKLCFFIQL